MKSEYTNLIAEHDKTLSMLREMWMGAGPDEKSKHMERINVALDSRLRLMALRDSASA